MLARLCAGGEHTDASPADLCKLCAELTTVSGVGIMLMVDEAARGTVAATDAVSAQIEELQYTLGEGPCVDAYHEGRVVCDPDLARADPSRWPAFGPGALKAGARAVFGFPIKVGSVRLGTLDLYRDQPGPLTTGEQTDASVLSDMVGLAVLLIQAESSRRVGAGLDATADFRRVVHQASGMVSVQLGVSVPMALICLRASAFANERPINAIAQDVVTRTLHLD